MKLSSCWLRIFSRCNMQNAFWIAIYCVFHIFDLNWYWQYIRWWCVFQRRQIDICSIVFQQYRFSVSNLWPYCVLSVRKIQFWTQTEDAYGATTGNAVEYVLQLHLNRAQIEMRYDNDTRVHLSYSVRKTNATINKFWAIFKRHHLSQYPTAFTGSILALN